jgi:hypothetical protein
MIEKRHKEQNCFGGQITGTNVTNPKIALDSNIGEDVGFRDNIFF